MVGPHRYRLSIVKIFADWMLTLCIACRYEPLRVLGIGKSGSPTGTFDTIHIHPNENNTTMPLPIAEPTCDKPISLQSQWNKRVTHFRARHKQSPMTSPPK